MMRLSFCVVAALSAGCVDPRLGARLDRIENQIAQMRDQDRLRDERNKAFEAEMREGLTIALCKPEIRQLIDDVQRECAAAESPTGPSAMCTTKKIHPAVVTADPEHMGRFLKFMTYLRHEVFYIRPSATEIMSSRKKRLERLAQQPLKNTKYLVVSHPVAKESAPEKEARQRADVISGFLREFGVPEAKILQWIYAFPLGKADITYPADRPVIGEPTDLNRSVWVFRADC